MRIRDTIIDTLAVIGIFAMPFAILALGTL
jgi:hypothetical protein